MRRTQCLRVECCWSAQPQVTKGCCIIYGEFSWHATRLKAHADFTRSRTQTGNGTKPHKLETVEVNFFQMVYVIPGLNQAVFNSFFHYDNLGK